MARMIPPLFPKGTGSEKRVFDRMREGLPDSWVAIHSSDLAHHPDKPWAEIDFVLVGPRGVLCLEVKGGRRIEVEGKTWRYYDGAGAVVTRHESPFAQVGGASSALHKWMTGIDGSMRSVPVYWGVLFPFMPFEVEGAGIVREVVYAAPDEGKPFTDYTDRVFDYWATRTGRLPKELDSATVSRVARLVAPSYTMTPRLSAVATAVRDELVRLTDEQAVVLAGFSRNPRVMVSGGAGTGKTLLAVDEARRLAADGRRVLLCCYNRNLGDYLARETEGEGIKAGTLHALMRELAEAGGTDGSIPADVSQADYYGLFLPLAAVDAVASRPDLKFEALVVDEGQDLMSDAFSEVLDALLAGGINDGDWRVFRDNGQNVYGGVSVGGAARFFAARPFDYHLTENCRNTRQVALQTALLSDREPSEIARVDGPQPAVTFCRDDGHQARSLGNSVNRLLSDGIAPSEIVILGPHRYENSGVSGGLPNVPASVVPWSLAPRVNEIRYETMRGFKGLEATAVLVIDINEANCGHLADDLYVACSRPTVQLEVFLADGLSGWYEERVERLGDRVFGGLEIEE